MTKEQLENMNVKQLRDRARDLNISGRWDMSKPQLIEAILAKQEAEQEVEQKVEQVKEQKQEATPVQATKKVVEIDKKVKEKYLVSVEAGTIVAFRNENGETKSAKVKNRSVARRELKLETAYGKELIVSFDSIVWVRTGSRWPKGVYDELKGGNSNVKEKHSATRA